jgi:hypothetical protein
VLSLLAAREHYFNVLLQKRYQLQDVAEMEHARIVFHAIARKIVKDALCLARVQATSQFFKQIKGQAMSKHRGAARTYLTEEEYGQVKHI